LSPRRGRAALSALLGLALAGGCAPAPEGAQASQALAVPGDANGDGAVDALDLQICIAGVLGTPTPAVLAACDLNKDGSLDALDVQAWINIYLGASAAPFKLAVSDAAPSLKLNAATTITVTVTPLKDVGTLTLTATGLPAKVTGTFSPATVSTSGTAPIDVTLTLSAASDTVEGSSPVTIGATGQTVTAAVTLTVVPELVLRIGRNVVISAPNPLAFYPQPQAEVLYVRPSTKITFENDDTIQHQIHVDSGLTGCTGCPTYQTVGFLHEPSPLGAAQYDATGNVSVAGGTYSYSIMISTAVSTDYVLNFHCHIHPNMMGSIVLRMVP
jgi:plastocyanin